MNDNTELDANPWTRSAPDADNESPDVDDACPVPIEPSHEGAVSLATTLHDEGVGAEDVADAFRSIHSTRSQLLRAMTQAGFSSSQSMSALRHLGGECRHSGIGEIGALPQLPRSRPRICAMDNDIRGTASDAWAAVSDANDPAQFFNYGEMATWIKAGEHDHAVVEEITRDRMLFLIGEVGDWWRLNSHEKQVPCRPPRPVAAHMVAEPHPPLPRLRRLVTVPVFDAVGHLVLRPGYHESSGLFLATQRLMVPTVMHAPTTGELAKAKKIVLEDLLGDFPFVDESDLANAVALFLLPFVRDLIDGPTPLHLVTKPKPGSGGTLLVEMLLYPAVGKTPPMQVMPPNESEVQRRITAALMLGPAAVVFDNLRTGKTLDSAQLASALTAREWEDRQIRTSTLLTLPIANAWVATGNDVKVSDEIARRTLPIRLDPQMENPFERKGFRHPNIGNWVAQNRGDLVWAALTIVQNWVAAGMPKGALVVGMYENWAEVMAGIMDMAELPGPRANWADWNRSRRSDEDQKHALFAAWWHSFGDRSLKATELLPILGPLLSIDPLGGRSSATQLGSRLRQLQGKVDDGREIVGHLVSGSTTWQLATRR